MCVQAFVKGKTETDENESEDENEGGVCMRKASCMGKVRLARV